MSRRDTIIRAFRDKEKIEQERKTLLQQLDKLESKLKKNGDRLDLAEQVDEIYKGAPLRIYKEWKHWFSVQSPLNNRWAQTYLNQHNKKTFGVSLKQFEPYRDFCVGANFKTFKEVLKIAKEWVAFGRLPKKRGKMK